MGFFALFSGILCLQSLLTRRETMFLSSIPMIGIKWLGHGCRYDVFVVSGAQWELTCKRKRPDFLYPQAHLGTQRRRPCTGTGYVK